MPKKKFINKKKAVTFQLVHRSQEDPLTVDENAPQRVLNEIKPKETAEERAARIEEQHKFGVYFTDDTNYLEFLKERSDNHVQWPENIESEIEDRKKRFALPSAVFPSTSGQKVGTLNEAVSGPQLELDPDIVAALDGDFDFDDPENELEENFMELAGDEVLDLDDFDRKNLHDDNCSEMDMDSDQGQWSENEYELDSTSESFSDEETKSRFTNYSVSSPMVEGNEEMQLLTMRFDKMLEKFYESDEDEDIRGLNPADSEQLSTYVEEFEKRNQTHQIDKDDEANAITKALAKRKNAFKTEYIEVEVEKKPEFDCQTILSTYSNIHNRPKLIEYVPQKQRKMKLTQAAMKKLESAQDETAISERPESIESRKSRLTILSIRDKNETPEEKRIRKAALKEYRQERRREKKSNKQAFTAEIQRKRKVEIANKRGVSIRNKFL